jgi:hypothetical protein
MPWAFMMTYDHQHQHMNIQCSEAFSDLLELNDTHIHMNQEDIATHVHKYDHRKLSYFTTADLHSTFDTLLRIRLTPDGPYFRTIAVCNQTNLGFSCMHMLEKDVLLLRKTAQLTYDEIHHIKLEMMDGEWIKTMHLTQQIPKFKEHLPQLINRP